MLQGPTSLGIRDHLDRTAMRLKENQIKRLQDKIKQGMVTEVTLKNQMEVINTNDRNLVQKLGESNCYGEVEILVQTPVSPNVEDPNHLLFAKHGIEQLAIAFRDEIISENITPAVED